MDHKARAPVISILSLADGSNVKVSELAPPAESFGRGQFMVLFQDAVRQAVNEFRSGPALRVLLALPDILDWRAWRRLDQIELSTRLGIARPDITRILLELLEKGYIERRGKRSQYEWRLLPRLGWRGSVRQYHQAVGALAAEREPALPLGPVPIAESISRKLPAARRLKVVSGSLRNDPTEY
jgi:hypothetical protein